MLSAVGPDWAEQIISRRSAFGVGNLEESYRMVAVLPGSEAETTRSLESWKGSPRHASTAEEGGGVFSLTHIPTRLSNLPRGATWLGNVSKYNQLFQIGPHKNEPNLYIPQRLTYWGGLGGVEPLTAPAALLKH